MKTVNWSGILIKIIFFFLDGHLPAYWLKEEAHLNTEAMEGLQLRNSCQNTFTLCWVCAGADKYARKIT